MPLILGVTFISFLLILLCFCCYRIRKKVESDDLKRDDLLAADKNRQKWLLDTLKEIEKDEDKMKVVEMFLSFFHEHPPFGSDSVASVNSIVLKSAPPALCNGNTSSSSETTADGSRVDIDDSKLIEEDGAHSKVADLFAQATHHMLLLGLSEHAFLKHPLKKTLRGNPHLNFMKEEEG